MILVSLVFVLVSGTVSASSANKKKATKASAKAKPKVSFLSKNKTVTTASSQSSKTALSAEAAPAQPSKSGLSTDVRFGDQSVGGKYQLPMEALSVVENEKSIDDLIGVRKNFQDRVTRTKGMR
jgi:hypothetical protein